MDDWDSPDEDRLVKAKMRLENMILEEIWGHERSMQRVIGPSGLGTPCQSELAYRLMSPDTREVERPQEQWRQFVGTAIHNKLDDAGQRQPEGTLFPERRVTVGVVHLPGRGPTEISGTGDVGVVAEDDGSIVVVDYKTGGITSLKEMRKNGPPKVYKRQVHLYGRGYELLGYRVTHVAILRLPSAGEWRDRVWFSEPYDRSIAERTLERASALGRAIDEHGLDAVLDVAGRVDHHCNRCPFALPSESWPQCPTAG